jgi:hypothetical protein
MKKDMRPLVIYISPEESAAIDALVSAKQILDVMKGERVSRTSVARELLLRQLPSYESLVYAINEMAKLGAPRNTESLDEAPIEEVTN